MSFFTGAMVPHTQCYLNIGLLSRLITLHARSVLAAEPIAGKELVECPPDRYTALTGDIHAQDIGVG